MFRDELWERKPLPLPSALALRAGSSQSMLGIGSLPRLARKTADSRLRAGSGQRVSTTGATGPSGSTGRTFLRIVPPTNCSSARSRTATSSTISAASRPASTPTTWRPSPRPRIFGAADPRLRSTLRRPIAITATSSHPKTRTGTTGRAAAEPAASRLIVGTPPRPSFARSTGRKSRLASSFTADRVGWKLAVARSIGTVIGAFSKRSSEASAPMCCTYTTSSRRPKAGSPTISTTSSPSALATTRDLKESLARSASFGCRIFLRAVIVILTKVAVAPARNAAAACSSSGAFPGSPHRVAA